jgi:hypothetical protein
VSKSLSPSESKVVPKSTDLRLCNAFKDIMKTEQCPVKRKEGVHERPAASQLQEKSWLPLNVSSYLLQSFGIQNDYSEVFKL